MICSKGTVRLHKCKCIVLNGTEFIKGDDGLRLHGLLASWPLIQAGVARILKMAAPQVPKGVPKGVSSVCRCDWVDVGIAQGTLCNAWVIITEQTAPRTLQYLLVKFIPELIEEKGIKEPLIEAQVKYPGLGEAL